MRPLPRLCAPFLAAILALSSIAPPTAAQDAPSTPSSLPWPATGSISGRVTAADTGEPLAGVSIHLRFADGSTRFVSPTDASGAYTAADLPNGRYSVEFLAPFGSPFLSETYINRPRSSLGDPVLVAFGAAVTGVDAALERGGAVQGRITADDTGQGLGFGTILIEGVNVSDSLTVIADSAGEFATREPLHPGIYRAYFAPSGGTYVPEFSGDSQTREGAATFTVAAGQTTTVSAELARSVSFRGRVIAEDSAEPLGSVPVRMYNAAGTLVGTSQTDASGSYTVNSWQGLPAGSYRLEFGAPEGTGYLGEFYSDAATLDAATPVAAAAGETRTVDAALARGGQIAGRVTDERSGAPVAGVRVEVSSGGRFFIGTTGGDGRYTVSGAIPTGSYRVRFVPPVPNDPRATLAAEYYDNSATPEGASQVSVQAGSTTGGVDAALGQAPLLAGRVTAGDTGQPIAGVGIVLNVPLGIEGGQASVTTGPDGTYAFANPLFAPGTYRIAFVPPASPPSPYLRAAQTVTVAAGQTTLDVPLTRGGTIAGRVTAADTGAGLNEVYVTVSGLDAPFTQRVFSVDGRYTTTQPLPPGRYTVHVAPQLQVFEATGEFTFLFRAGRAATYTAAYAGGAADVDGATPVTVGAGQSVALDVVLARGGTVSGRVSRADGELFTNRPIDIYDVCDARVGFTYAGTDGRYQTPALPAGVYRLGFTREVFSGGAGALGAAAPITVTLGADSGGADVTIPTYTGAISGRIYEADTGALLPFASVTVVDERGTVVASAASPGDGTFRAGNLPDGTYRLMRGTGAPDGEFDRPFAGRYFGGATLATATPVLVSGGGETAGIDFAVARGSTITGQIVGDGAGGLGGITVRLYDAAGALVREARSQSSGFYGFASLPPGAYRAEYDPTNAPVPSAGYARAFSGGAASLDTATPILLGGPGVLVESNIVLARGGTISGRVVGPDGAPATFVEVRAYDAVGRVVATSLSVPPEGRYVLPVPAGTFRVGFNTDLAQGRAPVSFAPFGGAYHGGLTLDAATPVAVAAGADVEVNGAVPAAGFIVGQVADLGGTSAGRQVLFFDASGRHVATALTNEFQSDLAVGGYRSPPLAPGVYRVQFGGLRDGLAERVPSQPEFFRSAPNLAGSQQVTVVAGQTTAGVDATLGAPARICGRVTAASLLPTAAVTAASAVPGVIVTVYDGGGRAVAEATTDADGRFTTPGLVPGAYRVGMTPPVGSGFAPTFHPRRASLAEAVPVAVRGALVLASPAAPEPPAERRVYLPLTRR